MSPLVPVQYTVWGSFVLVWGWRSARTLTNGAEDVVRWLLSQRVVKPGHRILYGDTDGQWDEMLHNGTRFLDFHFLGAKDAQEALDFALKNPPPERQTAEVDTHWDADDKLADLADQQRD